MKNIKITLLLGIFIIAGSIYAQQTPSSPQTDAVTIVGATAHIGNGEVIENSLIIFENGILTQVLNANETKMQYPGNIIDAKGKHVYP
ncbi:MAG TPA: hypothetical protein VK833_08880, partial [Gillisia sp.]|nr:hypothetical protein [Gillisia sp.]